MTTSDIAQLLADIERAGDTVPPSWPLSSTIAVNPLAGFEDRPFAQGVVEGADLFGGRGLLTLADASAISGRSKASLYRHFKAGELALVKIGHSSRGRVGERGLLIGVSA